MKIKTILALVAFVIGFSVMAQDQITEGRAISTQKITSDNEQVNGQLALMGDLTTTTYFKNGKSRSEVSNPMSGNITTVIDADSKQMLMLMDNPMAGKKYMISSIEPTEEDLKNLKITKGDSKKTILGYACQQYFVTMVKDGQEVKMELFVTDKIPVTIQNTTLFGDQLEGFPLYTKIVMNQMGTNMTIETEVTDIKKEAVADSQFDMTPPNGYEKIQQ